MNGLIAQYAYLPAAAECGCIWTHDDTGYVEVHLCEWHARFKAMPLAEKLALAPNLIKCRGTAMCEPHRTSGAPAVHSLGCEPCEIARSRGVIRPDMDLSLPLRRRVRKSIDLYAGGSRGHISGSASSERAKECRRAAAIRAAAFRLAEKPKTQE